MNAQTRGAREGDEPLGSAARFLLPATVIGAAAGLALQQIVTRIEDADAVFPVVTAVFILAFTKALLLLARAGGWLVAGAVAAGIALLLAAVSGALADLAPDENRLDMFPVGFWFVVGAPLSGFLMTTLAKAALGAGRAPPPYRAVFAAGVAIPLILASAALFSWFTVLLLFAWAQLLHLIGVDLFLDLFQTPSVMIPIGGGLGGLSIALVRGQESVLGALRFVLLLLCRIAMPVIAVFSLTFCLAVAVNGPAPIFAWERPSWLMLGLSLAAMLVFNGVHQTGEGPPPRAWLRIATLIAIATFPVYAGLAGWALWLRVAEHGLTPARIFGLAVNGLVVVYAVGLLAASLTEIGWPRKRWLPLVGPFNTAMAALWVVVLIALHTPPLDPWRMTAEDQFARFEAGETSLEDFDFAYARFRLGVHGEEILNRMTNLSGREDLAEIRAEVRKVRSRENEWDYNNLDEEASPTPEEAPDQDGEPDNAPSPSETAPEQPDEADGADALVDAPARPLLPGIKDDPSYRPPAEPRDEGASAETPDVEADPEG